MNRPRIEKKATFEYQVPLWGEHWTVVEVPGYSIDAYDAAEEIGEQLANGDSDVQESMVRGLEVLVRQQGKEPCQRFTIHLDYLPQVTVKEA